jgi:virulence-associated protein VagC
MARRSARAATAKVFWSGRSQAIRLPLEYRLACREVRLRRVGKNLVLEPIEEETDANGWPLSFLSYFSGIGPDERLDLGDRTARPEREAPLS